MVALPVLILLIGAGAVAIARRDGRRGWAATVAFAAGAWIATLLAARTSPGVLSLSPWQPTSIFLDRIQFTQDGVGWPLQFAIVSALLGILLASPLVAGPLSPSQRARLLAYSAAAVVAVQAGNLLTVAVCWTVLDLGSAGMLLGAGSKEGESWRASMTWNVASVTLVVAATVALPGSTSTVALADLSSRPISVVLVAAGVAVRFAGAWNTARLQRAMPSSGAVAIYDRMLPCAAGFAVLARAAGSAAGPMPLWVAGVGVVACATGAAIWTSVDTRIATAGPPIALGGAAAVSMTVSSETSAAVWSSAGVLAVFTITLIAVWAPHSRLPRGVALLGALALAGLPATPGWLVAARLAAGEAGIPGWVASGIGLIGLGGLAFGLWSKTALPVEPWPKVERMSRAAHGLSLALVAAILPIAYWHLRVSGRVPGLVGSAAGLAIFGAWLLLARQIAPERFRRGFRATRWLDPAPVLKAVASLGGMARWAIERVADLLEGEAAMLWIYVVILALGLAAGLTR